MQFQGRINKPQYLTFIFCILGMAPTLYYIFYHFNRGDFLSSVINIVNSMFLIFLIVMSYHGKIRTVHQNIMAVVFGSFALYASYVFDIRGVVYIYPIIAILFFNFHYKKALYISVVLASFALFLVSLNQKIHFVFGISISLTITIIISFLYSKTIQNHKQALLNEANQDYLTGHGNRRSIENWIKDHLHNLPPTSELVIYYIDVDNFKRINDIYGHVIGDKVLQNISQRLDDALKMSPHPLIPLHYKLSRIAGDEFVIAIEWSQNNALADEIGKLLLHAVSQTFWIDQQCFSLNASIGIAIAKGPEITPIDLISNADQAMFKAKKHKVKSIQMFDHDLFQEITQKNQIIFSLKEAINNKGFFLNFMPIYNKNADSISRVEVLIRSNNSVLSKYGPEVYIPIAEEMGLINKIDLLVIQESFSIINQLMPYLNNDQFVFSINISAQELHNHNFLKDVSVLATKYNIQPHNIEFEITETSLVHYDESAKEMLHSIKTQGYKLALDDFGTGYTAFNQLGTYPIDTLKIDRSFIWALSATQSNEGSMASLILSLAKLYNLTVVAEGVEEQYQLDYLQSLDCSLFQGYLLSKPIDLESFKQQLLKHKLMTSLA